jgi:hypothetical protein
MLFLGGAKVIHGRPTKFSGYWETGCPNALFPPTIKWSGPAKDGWLIDPLLREHPFHLKEVPVKDEL